MNIFQWVMSNTIAKELFLLIVRSVAAGLVLTVGDLADLQNSVTPFEDLRDWAAVTFITIIATIAGQFSGWLMEKLGNQS